MGCCAALNCSNSSEKNFRMFRFPSDQERRKKWIANCRREGWIPGPNAQLCSEPTSSKQDTRPLCPCGKNDSSVNTRVVGGHAAGRKEFPFATGLLYHYHQTSLRQATATPFCGGTLITDRHVLTAAHCLKERSAEELSVDVGDYVLSNAKEGKVMSVRRLTQYPEYVPDSFHTDIGIVELTHPVRFENGLKTVQLPNSGLDLKPGTTVFAYGWGRLNYTTSDHPDVLQTVELPVMGHDDCQTKFTSIIDDGMLCAGGEEGKDACIGDSGSGLAVRMDNDIVLVGVVSFGRKCALAGVPGAYTKVSHFMDWIVENTQTAACRPCIHGESSS